MLFSFKKIIDICVVRADCSKFIAGARPCLSNQSILLTPIAYSCSVLRMLEAPPLASVV
jgi:hypothetical protein